MQLQHLVTVMLAESLWDASRSEIPTRASGGRVDLRVDPGAPDLGGSSQADLESRSPADLESAPSDLAMRAARGSRECAHDLASAPHDLASAPHDLASASHDLASAPHDLASTHGTRERAGRPSPRAA